MTDAKTLNELKLAAFRYSEEGLCVLPLADYEKNPHTILPTWTRYQTQKPTIDELESWFSNPRVTGIAVVCGEISGITVIDDDDYKTGNPLPFNSPIESVTATGGRHLYFAYSSDVENKNVRTEEHVFEVQNNRKLIVLPPSKAKNKKGEIGQYKWLSGDTLKFSDLPKIQIDSLQEFTSDGGTNSPQKLMELIKAPLGTQHHNLRTIIHKVLTKFAPDEWEAIAIPSIRAIAAEFDPPHPHERVEKLISDCVKFRLQKIADDKLNYPGDRYAMSNDQAWGIDQQVNDVNRSAVYQFNPSKLGDLREDDYEVEWVWEGVAAKGRITIFAAFPKTGKTTLLAHLVKRTGSGGFLADGRVETTKVLILSEESVSDWVQRREELGFSDNVSIQCSPILSTPNIKQWEAFMKEILAYCKKEEVEFVIFDTIAGMWPVLEENSAGEVTRAFLALRMLAQNNLAVMLVHHTNKNGGGNGRSVRGSGAINANGDFIAELDFVTNAPTQRSLSVVSRLRKAQSVVIDLINNEYLTVGSKAQAAWENRTAAVLTLIPASGKGVTVKQIHESWDDDVLGARPHERTIRRHCEELYKHGLIGEGDRKLTGKTFAISYVKATNGVTERLTDKTVTDTNPDINSVTNILNPLKGKMSPEIPHEQLPAFMQD